jgi:hypothetical protein
MFCSNFAYNYGLSAHNRFMEERQDNAPRPNPALASFPRHLVTLAPSFPCSLPHPLPPILQNCRIAAVRRTSRSTRSISTSYRRTANRCTAAVSLQKTCKSSIQMPYTPSANTVQPLYPATRRELRISQRKQRKRLNSNLCFRSSDSGPLV